MGFDEKMMLGLRLRPHLLCLENLFYKTDHPNVMIIVC